MRWGLTRKASHTDRVIHFKSLYEAVTEEIRNFRDDKSNELTEHEKEWLTSLISGFQERFEDWEKQETTYLDTLYKQGCPIFTLAGHAYLHVSYDLPLVIARSIRNRPEVGWKRATEIYLSLQQLFEKAIRADWRKPFPTELAPYVGFIPVFLMWLVALRSTAWLHAYCLAAATEADIQSVEETLHRSVQAGLNDARNHYSPWARIARLAAPGSITGLGVGIAVLIIALMRMNDLPSKLGSPTAMIPPESFWIGLAVMGPIVLLFFLFIWLIRARVKKSATFKFPSLSGSHRLTPKA